MPHVHHRAAGSCKSAGVGVGVALEKVRKARGLWKTRLERRWWGRKGKETVLWII